MNAVFDPSHYTGDPKFRAPAQGGTTDFSGLPGPGVIPNPGAMRARRGGAGGAGNFTAGLFGGPGFNLGLGQGRIAPQLALPQVIPDRGGGGGGYGGGGGHSDGPKTTAELRAAGKLLGNTGGGFAPASPTSQAATGFGELDPNRFAQGLSFADRERAAAPVQRIAPDMGTGPAAAQPAAAAAAPAAQNRMAPVMQDNSGSDPASLFSRPVTSSDLTSSRPRYATGGDVAPNSQAIVNDAGPEAFIPFHGRPIIPNAGEPAVISSPEGGTVVPLTREQRTAPVMAAPADTSPPTTGSMPPSQPAPAPSYTYDTGDTLSRGNGGWTYQLTDKTGRVIGENLHPDSVQLPPANRIAPAIQPTPPVSSMPTTGSMPITQPPAARVAPQGPWNPPPREHLQPLGQQQAQPNVNPNKRWQDETDQLDPYREALKPPNQRGPAWHNLSNAEKVVINDFMRSTQGIQWLHQAEMARQGAQNQRNFEWQKHKDRQDELVAHHQDQAKRAETSQAERQRHNTAIETAKDFDSKIKAKEALRKFDVETDKLEAAHTLRELYAKRGVITKEDSAGLSAMRDPASLMKELGERDKAYKEAHPQREFIEDPATHQHFIQGAHIQKSEDRTTQGITAAQALTALMHARDARTKMTTDNPKADTADLDAEISHLRSVAYPHFNKPAAGGSAPAPAPTVNNSLQAEILRAGGNLPAAPAEAPMETMQHASERQAAEALKGLNKNGTYKK